MNMENNDGWPVCQHPYECVNLKAEVARLTAENTRLALMIAHEEPQFEFGVSGGEQPAFQHGPQCECPACRLVTWQKPAPQPYIPRHSHAEKPAPNAPNTAEFEQSHPREAGVEPGSIPNLGGGVTFTRVKPVGNGDGKAGSIKCFTCIRFVDMDDDEDRCAGCVDYAHSAPMRQDNWRAG